MVSSAVSEGLVSTRLLLAACRLLEGEGVRATLTSVDLRSADHPYFERGWALLLDLGLAPWWRPAMGVDSVSWLREEAGRLLEGTAQPIDMAFVDSNHTYAQVRAELDALVPLMAPHGVVLIDNCYALLYEPGIDWIQGDGAEGADRGGEYGAILEFLAAHPEWSAQWDGRDLAVLRRSNYDAAIETTTERNVGQL
jgi:Methyltransferase domain